MRAPLVVADRRAVPASELAAWRDGGWSTADGFALPAAPWDLGDRRWIRCGLVEGEDELRAAVLAAVRGVGVAVGCPDRARRDHLVDDLSRVGPVHVVLLGPDPLDHLDADQRAILEVLAGGGTIAEAATQALLSTRTAERRLAAARKALGVRTTAEAVAVATGSDAGMAEPG